MNGRDLRKYREDVLHMTQEELAPHLGVTVRTLSERENREGSIDVMLERAVQTVRPLQPKD